MINPDDAAALGIGDGDRVRVFSPVGAIELAAAVNDRPAPRRGRRRPRLGLKDFRPARRRQRRSPYGANRNLLVDGGPVDPLSQTSALSSSYVGVERVG